MAGVKGKSGGPRKNSGGARPGAGRKPKAPATLPLDAVTKAADGEALDPRPTLELVAAGHIEVSAQQLKALMALLPYVHSKQGDGGKKGEVAEKAKQAGQGRFKAAPSPLKLVGSR